MKIEDFRKIAGKLNPESCYTYELINWDVKFSLATQNAGDSYLAVIKSRDQVNPNIFYINDVLMVESIEQGFKFFSSYGIESPYLEKS